MKRFMKHHKWILSLLLVALIGVGATGAYLVASSGTVKNTFASGKVTTEIDEDVGEVGQKEVAIKNTGDLPVYVRARIVVGGANQKDVIYTTEVPDEKTLASSDKVYVILANQDAQHWQKNGGDNNAWYYYCQYLPSKAETDLLMTKVYIGGKANVDENHFTVTITQEAVVASDTNLSNPADIQAAFDARN